MRIAQLCALIANVNRDPKKRPQPWGIEDFMVVENAAKARKREGIAPETIAFLFAASGVAVPPELRGEG